MTSLETLKQKFSDAWLKLCVNLHERLPEKGTTYLYGLLGATALAPVLNEPSYAVAKLTEVIGAVGIETMGSLLDEFRNKKDEAERARLLEQAAQNSGQIREVLDDLLQKVEAIPQALRIYSQQHQAESERQWFANALQTALRHAGSRLQITAQVKTGADSPVAIGEKAEALSKSVKLENVQAGQISIHLDAGDSGAEGAFSSAPQRRYLEKLQRYCNLFPLAAIAKESDPHASLRLPLDKVYIGLNTTLWVDERGNFVQREALQSRKEREKTRPFTTLEAAAAEPRFPSCHLAIVSPPRILPINGHRPSAGEDTCSMTSGGGEQHNKQPSLPALETHAGRPARPKTTPVKITPKPNLSWPSSTFTSTFNPGNSSSPGCGKR